MSEKGAASGVFRGMGGKLMVAAERGTSPASNQTIASISHECLLIEFGAKWGLQIIKGMTQETGPNLKPQSLVSSIWVPSVFLLVCVVR